MAFFSKKATERTTSSNSSRICTDRNKLDEFGTVTLLTNSSKSTSSNLNDCVFYRGEVIFIVYVDNGIFLGSSDKQLSGIITELRNLDLDIEDQGHPADYVGVNIKRMKDGSIGLSQRALIDPIIQDADLQDSKVKAVPAKFNEHLHAHLDKAPFSLNFNYRSMIDKLNYLAQTTRPDIMYATHQLAKYSSNPREPHGDAALYLV
jgi:hypothetical protein